MKLNEYQQLALKTHDSTLSKQHALTQYTLGFLGEIGEIAEHIKKNQFQNQPLDLQAFSLDLGDCLWYLTTLAHVSGFTLEQIADKNVHKLKTRYPDKFQ